MAKIQSNNSDDSAAASTPSTGWWPSRSPGLKAAVVGLVGVAATATGLVAPNLATGASNLDSINGCAMEGAAKSGSWQWEANPLKNRYVMPSGEDLDGSATLASMLIAKDGTTFDATKSADIDGYITYVKVGGNESCNCGSNDPQYMDTHIYVGPGPKTAHNQCIIVEVTPRIREVMSQQGVDWSTPTLIKTFTGQHVHVSGWLFDDHEHANASEIDNPGGAHNWRANCWEIHPVTDIQIVRDAKPPAGQTSAQSTPDGAKTELHSKSPVKSTPSGKASKRKAAGP